MQNDELSFLLRQGAGDGSSAAGECPQEADVAAFFEGALEPARAEELRRHLASCSACLALVGFLGRLADGPPPPDVPAELLSRVRDPARGASAPAPRRRAALAALTAAAAAVLLVVVVGDRREPGPPAEVRSGIELVEAPRILAPEDGALIAPRSLGDLDFRWAEVPGAIFYEIRLTTADGRLLWQDRTESPRLRLPATARLSPGGRYFVWVRAHLAEGKTLSSEIVGFQVAPGGAGRD